MNLYTSLTLRYLRENKKRTIVTIIGVILSTALVCGIGNIFESLMDSQIRETIKNKGAFHVVFNNVQKENLKYIDQNAEIEKIGLSSNLGSAITNNDKSKMLEIKEYDKNAFEGYVINLKEGRLPQSYKEIVLSKDSLIGFDKEYKVGDEITLEVGKRLDESGNETHGSSIYDGEYIDSPTTKSYKIVGIMQKPGFESGKQVTNGITYFDRGNLSEDKLINVSCQVKNPKKIYENGPIIAKRANMKGEVSEDGSYYDIWYNDHLLNLIGKSKYSHVSSSIISAVILVTSLVILATILTVYNAFSISIVERKKQFGVLSSIGATNSQIVNMVLAEGIIVSAIGIPIGLACGTVAIDLVFKFIEKFMANSTVAHMELKIIYSPKIIVLSGLIVLATIFIAVMIPARTAAKVSPLEAIKNTGDYKIGKVKNSKIIKTIFKAEGVLAYKNLRRNKKRFRSTLFSLIISIVIFISFSGFMKIMLKGEEVRNAQMNYNFDLSSIGSFRNENNTKIIEELNKLDGVNNYSVINQLYHSQINLSLKESELNKEAKAKFKSDNYISEKIVDDIVYNTINNSLNFPGDKFIESIKLNEGSFDKEKAIKENGVILINKSSYSEPGKKGELVMKDYKVGDIIEGDLTQYGIDESEEENLPKKVNLKVMAITDEKLMGSFSYPDMGLDFVTYDEVANNLGIKLSKDRIFIDADNSEETKKAIENIAGKYEWNFTDESYWYESMKQTYAVIQIFVYGFIAVISLVSVTNIINTISTNINLRKKELSIIRSIGVTPYGFNKMIYLESLLYGSMALLYGIPMGLGLSILMNNIISDVVSFGIVLPWEAVLISIVGVFVITFVSSYIPMRKLNKENIIENIRQESI